MKRISKFLVAVLVMGLLLSLMTVTAFAAVNVSSEEDIQDVIDDLDDGEEVTIRGNGDLYLEEGLEIEDSCTIHFENIRFVYQYGVSNKMYDALYSPAFYVDSDDVTLDFGSCTFENLVSIEDAIIYVEGNNCTIRGGVFNDCRSSDDGGVIYIEGDDYDYDEDDDVVITDGCIVVGCTFNNCCTDGSGDGGAIYLDCQHSLVSGCTFNNCKCTTDGGAIAVNQDGCSIENCNFTECKAPDDGGAIYLCTGVDYTYITNCKFSGCKWTSGWVGLDDSCGSIFSCNDNCSNIAFEGCTFTLNEGEDFDYAFDTVSSTSFKNCNQFNNEVSVSMKYGRRSASNTGSVLSTGNIVIICVVAVVAVAGVAAAVVVSKKKKAVAKN